MNQQVPRLMDVRRERELRPLRKVWDSVVRKIDMGAVQFWDTSILSLDADGYDPDNLRYVDAHSTKGNQRAHYRWITSWFGRRTILVHNTIFDEVFADEEYRTKSPRLWNRFRERLLPHVVMMRKGYPDLRGYSLPQGKNRSFFASTTSITDSMVKHLAKVLDTEEDPLSPQDQDLISYGASFGLITGRKIAIVSVDNKLREAVNDFRDVSTNYLEYNPLRASPTIREYSELVQQLDFFAPSPFNRYTKDKV